MLKPTQHLGKAGQVIEFTIPAHGEWTIKATGSHISILEASSRVEFKLDHAGRCRGMAGTSFSCELGAFYENVTFENPGDSEVKVMAYFGFAKYSESRAEFVPVYSVMRAQAFSEIPAGQSVTLSGNPIGGLFQRRAVFVSNMDPAAYLYVQDGYGNDLLTCFPKQSIVLETAGAVTVKNKEGIAIQCRVAEDWFANRASTIPPAPVNPFEP